MTETSEATRMLREWKGDSYVFGRGVLDRVGGLTKRFGNRTLILVSEKAPWVDAHLKTITDSLKRNMVSYDLTLGARPNCPREDLYRIALHIKSARPDSIIAFGGGSTIDSGKAASLLATYTPSEVSKALGAGWDEACTIDPYFGTGLASKVKQATGRDVLPVIAVQTAASSGAHLTKYSNITDPVAGQKKLIVDDAIVPKAALFDYDITIGAPASLTVDGGLDGIAHCWEVFTGATGKDYYEKVRKITVTSVGLIVKNLKLAKEAPKNVDARIALALGTDLGGYAIMIGGTSGPHLGSFSLVDILSHGRACAILNPYYTVLFAPNIQDQLRTIGPILQEAGYTKEDTTRLEGRSLGEAVAKGMINLLKALGVPTTLREAGATREHVERMLVAAKDPQLKMKLLNMPTPLDPDKGDIENYMKPVVEASFTGDLKAIKTVKA
jgi:alcohol dehydrogenase